MNTKGDAIIRQAQYQDIEDVRGVLSRSFEPYRSYYTKEAFKATVLPSVEIKKRINDLEVEVLVAVHNGEIVGTASVRVDKEGNLHIRSMAVKPRCQGKGIGWQILEKIRHLGIEKDCEAISLNCYEPLIDARRLYKKFGFKEGGRKERYHGIEIFEMKKSLITEG